MSINWADLARVAWVSLAFAVGISVVFALGVIGAGQVEQHRSGGAGVLAYGVAGLCFAICAAAAVYGIYLIVPQFH